MRIVVNAENLSYTGEYCLPGMPRRVMIICPDQTSDDTITDVAKLALRISYMKSIDSLQCPYPNLIFEEMALRGYFTRGEIENLKFLE